MHMSLPIAFGPLGTQEMILIFLILLLLFGAKKLPQLARGIGKSMGEFKKAREDFEDEIRKGGEDIETKTDKASEPRES
jgi:sec-independent protein translocase protein TatA